MKLLVLDGNSILNRAFYGIKLLTTKNGEFFTNAIYGFLTMMNKVENEVKPNAVAVAFDLKAPTFRHKAYAEYKANRKGMPDELAAQMPILKELLTYMGYNLIECEGYEADDILGTLAKACENTNNECIIATGDKDSLQLVSENVTVRNTITKMNKPEVIVYDVDKIKEVYEVEPKQLIDIKAIQGDKSDNIPGVVGIGEKGAKELIKKFGSLKYIYDNIDTIDIKDNMRKKLIENKDNAEMSYMLGTIVTNVPIDTNINSYICKPVNTQKAVSLMAKLELFSLIEKYGFDISSAIVYDTNNGNEKDYKIKLADNSFEKINQILNNTNNVYMSFGLSENDIKSVALLYNDELFIIDDKEKIVSILTNDKICKYVHNVKALYTVANKLNIEIKNIVFDTMLAGYILNPSASSYDIDRLCAEYNVNKCIIDNVEISEKISEVLMLYPLSIKLEKQIKENNQLSLLQDIEIPFANVLANMENVGFEVDKQSIKNYGIVLEEKIEKLQQEIYNEVGYEFNINSPKQLGVVLFEKLGLKKGKKTKTGYSTNAEVLEELKYEHIVVEKILEYRTLAKLKSTYCDGLIKVIANDGRIHSNFNQTETRTGRISSTEPNLQNIPVKTNVGRELRKFFVAKEGYVLVDADYSQIELRVLAHIANDENMIKAFNDNIDIHTVTASQVFDMPIDMVTPLMRSRAKAVNFGIVYGIGAFSLSKDIGVSRKEANDYIKSYISVYSGVDKYMQNIITKARYDGYVQTLFGRRRYLPELNSSNFNTRAFGERVARNMPIQGTAADIIKIAMIRVFKRLKSENLKARLILQVHDELIVEAPVEEAGIVKKLLTEEMQGAMQMKAPLLADSNIGKTWYDAKS